MCVYEHTCAYVSIYAHVYPPPCRRAQGACYDPLVVGGFGGFWFPFRGEGGRAGSVIFDSHNFFGLFFDVWFDSPSGYRFLVLSDLFWASLRD